MVADRIAVVGSLLELYRAGLPLGATLASSERQHGDDFLLLAAHELVDLYAHSGAFCTGDRLGCTLRTLAPDAR